MEKQKQKKSTFPDAENDAASLSAILAADPTQHQYRGISVLPIQIAG